MIFGLDTGFLVAAEIVEHPLHASVRRKLSEVISAGHRLCLAPQVLTEFIHVVTDAKRFPNPLSVDRARQLASDWWFAEETGHAFPDDQAVELFLDWHRIHRLGRKRLIDPLLAATYCSTEVTSILTTNPGDFAVLESIEAVVPDPPDQDLT